MTSYSNSRSRSDVQLLPCEKDIRISMEENIKLNEESTKDIYRDIKRYRQKGNECDDPIFMVNLGDIIMKYKNWLQALPRVKPFYAVKCNTDHQVLKLLVDMGLSFDCASKIEIETMLDLGVSANQIVYSNPCKQISMLKYASKVGVSLMTFDNESELYKIKHLYPAARLMIRLLPIHEFNVHIDLGTKYGCHPSTAAYLLQLAKSLGLTVVGVSFHIGMGCKEPNAYTTAIKECRGVYDIAKDLGFPMNILDIGGGLSGYRDAPTPFSETARVINESLDAYFPAEENIKIIAEPGTYFVQSAFTLLVNIISKRIIRNSIPDGDTKIMYYANDGVFGSFRCIKEIKTHTELSTLKSTENEDTHECQIWGPTLASIDVVVEKIRLPELDVGDWLCFENMGAYTKTCGCPYNFNGMPGPRNSYFCVNKLWYDVYPCEKSDSFE